MASQIKLDWYRMSRTGTLASKPKQHPEDDGVYVATLRLPYTDGQTTVEYMALGVVIMPPILCHHGQARGNFIRTAQNEAKNWKNPNTPVE